MSPYWFPESFTIESKSIISPIHSLLLHQDIEQSNSEMVYQDWSINRNEYHDRIWHDPIQHGDNNIVNRLEIKGKFFRTPHSLDWAILALIRPPPQSLP